MCHVYHHGGTVVVRDGGLVEAADPDSMDPVLGDTAADLRVCRGMW